MKIAFFILVAVHAIIHIIGFIKGFGLRDVKELTLPITKPMGLLWLTAALLLLAFGMLFIFHSKYAGLAGLLAVLISQILLFLFWKDAKFGTLPNIIILLVSLILYGRNQFQVLVRQETSHLLSQQTAGENKILQDIDIEHLPDPVKKWLNTCGAVGKPIISMGRVTQKAEMKMNPQQKKWLPATAIQYTTIHKPAFIWSVDVKMNNFLQFTGRDKFENGKGEMLIKMNALVNVVNEEGEKLDEGALQRFLGEMVWFPSMAIKEYISWKKVNDSTAIATMNYKGTTGSGTFHFSAGGAVTRFTALRYKGNDKNAKKYDWIMDITDYRTFEGIQVPALMTSTWQLEEDKWTWLKLQVTDITYNW